jgi:hypothetical protein
MCIFSFVRLACVRRGVGGEDRRKHMCGSSSDIPVCVSLCRVCVCVCVGGGQSGGHRKHSTMVNAWHPDAHPHQELINHTHACVSILPPPPSNVHLSVAHCAYSGPQAASSSGFSCKFPCRICRGRAIAGLFHAAYVHTHRNSEKSTSRRDQDPWITAMKSYEFWSAISFLFGVTEKKSAKPPRPETRQVKYIVMRRAYAYTHATDQVHSDFCFVE